MIVVAVKSLNETACHFPITEVSSLAVYCPYIIPAVSLVQEIYFISKESLTTPSYEILNLLSVIIYWVISKLGLLSSHFYFNVAKLGLFIHSLSGGVFGSVGLFGCF